MMQINGKNYLTSAEVAERLAVSAAHVRHLSRQNMLKSLRILRARYYEPDDVQALIDHPPLHPYAGQFKGSVLD